MTQCLSARKDIAPMSQSVAEPRPCPTCDGSGRIDLKPCPPCNGNGKVLVYTPFVKCPHCEGNGKRQPGDPYTAYCGVCRGRGWALSFAISEEPETSTGDEWSPQISNPPKA